VFNISNKKETKKVPFFSLVDGQWTTWSSASPCSTTCGTGYVRVCYLFVGIANKFCSFLRRFVHVRAHKSFRHLAVLSVQVQLFSMKHVHLRKIVQVNSLSYLFCLLNSNEYF